MGLFRRVNDIISANLNDLVDRFEDPEKMLKQAIREMETAIDEATAAAAKAIAGEKLLTKQVAEHQQQVSCWQVRAEQAVQAGDDELARQALRRKSERGKLVRALSDQLAAARQTGETLRRQVEAMRAKHAEAKRKLATLTARSKAAYARRQLHVVSAGCTLRTDPFHQFDRIREQVELAEAEADAMVALTCDNDDSVTAAIPDQDDLAVETELASLKSLRKDS
jgi:phage shock protein A